MLTCRLVFLISTAPALVNKLKTPKKVSSVALGVLDYNTFPVTNESQRLEFPSRSACDS